MTEETAEVKHLIRWPAVAAAREELVHQEHQDKLLLQMPDQDLLHLH
jgi:hypothetical protein